jgi:ketosteroid isomerase-like protein
MGRLEGAEAYVTAMAALLELSPDVMIEMLYYVTVQKHGFVGVGHTFGTFAAAGGPFEFFSILIVHVRDGRLAGAELFEVDDFERALARFADLRPPGKGTHHLGAA